jgi:hypothetical protein
LPQHLADAASARALVGPLPLLLLQAAQGSDIAPPTTPNKHAAAPQNKSCCEPSAETVR